MTVAAAAVVAGDPLLDIAVRFGYGSTEAFGRAFRAVHGSSPAEVRVTGGPLRAQPKLRLRLTVEGNTTMDTRIAERPAFRLVGHATRVPLIHEGINPHIQQFVAALPASEHARLKGLSSTEPGGLLQVSDGVDPDYREGTELTYLHGVAMDAAASVPADLDVIEVEAGEWGGVPHVGALPRSAPGGLRGIRVGLVPVQPLAAASWSLDRRRSRSRRRLQHGYDRALDADHTPLAHRLLGAYRIAVSTPAASNANSASSASRSRNPRSWLTTIIAPR